MAEIGIDALDNLLDWKTRRRPREFSPALLSITPFSPVRQPHFYSDLIHVHLAYRRKNAEFCQFQRAICVQKRAIRPKKLKILLKSAQRSI